MNIISDGYMWKILVVGGIESVVIWVESNYSRFVP